MTKRTYKTRAARAVEWVAEDHINRSDAEGARKYQLLSSASLTHYRKKNKLGRDGKLLGKNKS